MGTPNECRVVSMLIEHVAFRPEAALHVAPSDDSANEVLCLMAQRGFAVHTAAGSWHFTEAGLAAVQVGQSYSVVASVCGPAPDYLDKAIGDMTNFEMLCCLEACGWEWKPLPNRKRRSGLALQFLDNGALSYRVSYGRFV